MSDKLKGLFGGGDDQQSAGGTDAGSILSGLFGGGEQAETSKANARDFVNRVRTGAPDEGFSQREALENLAAASRVSSPEQIKQATQSAVSNMPENDRAAFGKMLQERMGGVDRPGAKGQSGGNNVDDITGMLGNLFNGGGGGVGGLLGGLLGGGGSGSDSSSRQGGPGGLFGGGDANNKAVDSNSGGGGIDDLLGGIFGGSVGKAALGGIAATVISQIMDGKKIGGFLYQRLDADLPNFQQRTAVVLPVSSMREPGNSAGFSLFTVLS